MGYSGQFDPVAVPSAELIRRRLRRRRIRLAAVATSAGGMLAVTAVAAAAAVLPAWRQANPSNVGHHTSASPLGWLPAGPELPADARPEAAPYLTTLGIAQHRGQRAVVRDWRTGTLLGQVRPPDGRCFQQVVGASDDRTFLLTAHDCDGYNGTWFYQLRLTPAGHPEPLIPISLPRTLSYDGAFALSPDGTHLAYFTYQSAHQPNKSIITVYDLSTGARRTWFGPGLVGALAWAGNRTLAISLGWNGRTAPRVALGWRLLNTARASSSYLASRALTALATGDALPAAKNVIYASHSRIVGDHVWSEIARFSARTGQLELAFRPWLLMGHDYTWCDPLWTDGAGVHALAVCGSPGRGLQLDGNRMHLVNLHFPIQELMQSTIAYFYAF